jgi:superfamily I DNA/RNA helicase
MEVHRRIGAPGSGKTTFIVEALTGQKRKLNLAPEEIAMTTFTRIGRAEISERAAEEWGCSPERLTKGDGLFRTAHSLAMCQLGIKRSDIIGNPCKFLSENSSEPEDQCKKNLDVWELARSMGLNVRKASEHIWKRGGEYVDAEVVTHSIRRYESLKKQEGLFDFHDLIGKFAGVKFCPSEGSVEVIPEGQVPQNIKVFAVDEAQDSSYLVDKVCKRLANADTVQYVLLCGDPFQSIHGFCGSDYKLFMGWDAHEEVMPNSWRCPVEIFGHGEQCLRKMHEGYFDRSVTPAKHKGSVQVVSTIHEALNSIEGKSLLLTRCEYKLQEYSEVLSQRNIPFCNIDRRGSDKTSTGLSAIHSLANRKPIPASSWKEAVSLFVTRLDDEVTLERGAKASWEKKGVWNGLATVDLIAPTEDYLTRAGCTELLAKKILEGKSEQYLAKKVQKRAELWNRVARTHGAEQASDPDCKISTIHSAKGTEADTVVVSRSSSRRIAEATSQCRNTFDEECRVAYVAATRAKKKLVIVDDSEGVGRLPI